MAQNYDDIIHLERPVSKTHPRLSIAQRAAQFAPYKTITLYHDSTKNLEDASDIPDTIITTDEAQPEVAEEFYVDVDYDNEFFEDLDYDEETNQA